MLLFLFFIFIYAIPAFSLTLFYGLNETSSGTFTLQPFTKYSNRSFIACINTFGKLVFSPEIAGDC